MISSTFKFSAMTLESIKRCLLIFFVLLTSCTITTTKTKDPVFDDIAGLQKELVSMVSAENINLSGKETITNKKSISELEISITNGQDIPTTNDQIKALGKSIAQSVKKYLKSQDQFDTYKVLFVTKVENDNVTTTKWSGDIFKSQEL